VYAQNSTIYVRRAIKLLGPVLIATKVTVWFLGIALLLNKLQLQAQTFTVSNGTAMCVKHVHQDFSTVSQQENASKQIHCVKQQIKYQEYASNVTKVTF
jgi:hypothetical protein